MQAIFSRGVRYRFSSAAAVNREGAMTVRARLTARRFASKRPNRSRTGKKAGKNSSCMSKNVRTTGVRNANSCIRVPG